METMYVDNLDVIHGAMALLGPVTSAVGIALLFAKGWKPYGCVLGALGVISSIAGLILLIQST